MNIDELIKILTNIRNTHGNIRVMRDDLYTPASLEIQAVYVESYKHTDDELVAVLRD